MAESTKRKAPTPLRIPDAWEPEIEQARNRKGLTKHAWLLKAIRRVLDGEKNHAKNAASREASPRFKKGQP